MFGSCLYAPGASQIAIDEAIDQCGRMDIMGRVLAVEIGIGR